MNEHLAEAEEQNRQALEETLYTTRNPNAYVYNETMETLRRENVGTIDQMDMMYDIQIRVNRPAIEQALQNSGVVGGGTGGASAGIGATRAGATTLAET